MKKILKVMLLFLLISFLLIPFHGLNLLQNRTPLNKSKSPLIPRADPPIYIDGNYWLGQNATSGNGISTDPYIIENLVIDGSGLGVAGITINNTDAYFILRNCTVMNLVGYWGIYLDNVTNAHLDNNTIKNNSAGLNLWESKLNTISNNTVIRNSGSYGILVYPNSNNNTFIGNTANQNARGIYLRNSHNCTLIDNIANYNSEYGLMLRNGDDNTLSDNIVRGNWFDGIHLLDASDWNNISSNKVIDNRVYGISLTDSHNNVIRGNLLLENGQHIYEAACTGNTIENNFHTIMITKISDFEFFKSQGDGSAGTPYLIENYPVNASGRATDGITFENTTVYFILRNCTVTNADSGMAGIKLKNVTNGKLINNTVNFCNHGIFLESNCDNNALINNTANNNTENGIYLWSNCDWNNLTGNRANNNSQYGVYLKDLSNYNNVSWNTLLDNLQGIWEENCIGNIFYNNDISFSPLITIDSPRQDEIFGSVAPNFTINIYEPDLNASWYTLDNGTINVTIDLSGIISQANFNKTVSGIINQTEWNKRGDGPVSIKFYANDTWNFEGSSEVIVIKDSSVPQITIKSPNQSEIFGELSPSFIVEINDTHLDTMWYTIDGGLTNVTFTGNESVNQVLWDDLWHGYVTITFYANDTAGNIWFADVTVFKDIFTVYIDDSDPNFNWSKTAAENEWCSGSGTLNDPYIIENLSINRNNYGGFAEIKNSDAHFKIQNCTITNGTMGIRLINVSNACVVNTTIFNLNGNNGVNGGTNERGGNGTDVIGIELDNCLNITILSNQIMNISGGTGGEGGDGSNGQSFPTVIPASPGAAGGDGGNAYGLYLNRVINISVSNNNISNIFGGNGNAGGRGGIGEGSGSLKNGAMGGKGGIGGYAMGIYFKDSENMILSFNFVENITGGSGGNGGKAGRGDDGDPGGNGGTGGIGEIGGNALGLSFINSINITNYRSTLLNIIGGSGGTGGTGGNGGPGPFLGDFNTAGNGGLGAEGGLGGLAIGIFSQDSTFLTNYECFILIISGGEGGKGGQGGLGGVPSGDGSNGGYGNDGGNGSSGNFASGIYYENCTNIEDILNDVRNITGGAGGTGGDGGIGISGTDALGTGGDGGSGADGGDGGAGGLVSGIFYSNSSNITNQWNLVSNIFGAHGGDGGSGGNAGNGGIGQLGSNGAGGSGGDGGDGGDGGFTSGIHFENSYNSSNTWNLIYNLTLGLGALGGNNGTGGSGNPWGSDGVPGAKGTNNIANGFVLVNSTDCASYFNEVYCQNNTDNGTNNQWDDGNIGNYWSSYSGPDLNPRDGIGDDPFVLNGTAGAQDHFPIIYERFSDYDGDGLENFEEYFLGVDNYRTNVTNPDTDGDSFNDGMEVNFGTHPVNDQWYPMPNLKLLLFTVSYNYENQTLYIYFSTKNDGIWQAENITVTIECNELGLAFNFTYDLSTDESNQIFKEYYLSATPGTYQVDLYIDPLNLIDETYSLKNGSLRANSENDNFGQVDLTILSETPIAPDNTGLIIIMVILGVISGVLAVSVLLLLRNRRSLVKRVENLENDIKKLKKNRESKSKNMNKNKKLEKL